MAGKQRERRRDSPSAPREHCGLGPVEVRNPGSDTLELDRLIHDRVRLGIVSSLAVSGSLAFTDLRGLLGITDGNLSAHARRLEDAGYLTCSKSFEGRTPKTEYALTATGRKELKGYLDHMEAIIEATRAQGAG